MMMHESCGLFGRGSRTLCLSNCSLALLGYFCVEHPKRKRHTYLSCNRDSCLYYITSKARSSNSFGLSLLWKGAKALLQAMCAQMPLGALLWQARPGGKDFFTDAAGVQVWSWIRLSAFRLKIDGM